MKREKVKRRRGASGCVVVWGEYWGECDCGVECVRGEGVEEVFNSLGHRMLDACVLVTWKRRVPCTGNDEPHL